ncbi:hypothetical protein [Buchananella hordeovulneris]|uniref:hypothetical protein n=1 Tax=Buchananella hordeovulneris TaxID=52770 RepID=UPI000A7A3D97|nr:hypothetical protein [Buchananella hordeovulneris]
MRKLMFPAAAAALVLVACSAGAPASGSSPTSSSPAVAPTAASNSPTSTVAPEVDSAGQRQEVAALTPRIVLAADGGLTTLDAETGEVVATIPRPGFLRLNDAGDGRHVLVSDSDQFLVFDTGLEAEKHGDHYHYYQEAPKLTETSYPAPKAGHVVTHGNKTVLFADGDGSVQVIDSATVADPQAQVSKFQADSPHHGVAVALTDGSLFVTQGTEEERKTVQVRKDNQVTAETTDCPGSHGEAAAAPTANGDVIVIGCTNGPVVYRDGAFHKVAVADAYARSGNLAGSEASPLVLGDYKVDKDAEQERPTRVAIIDAHHDTLQLVDLGSSYWFRSLGRGPNGEGLVLTYDGHLQVIDMAGAAVTKKIPVISPWEEKQNWQEPGPILRVRGDKAYVTDAVKNELVVVDLTSQEVRSRFPLAAPAVEMTVVDGHAAKH